MNKRRVSRLIFVCGFSLVQCFTFPNNADQYMYPVAKTQDSLLVLYQKSLSEIELLKWNPASGHADQILSSRFLPVNVQMVPKEKSIFSFIDNGFLYLKDFNKRSPRLIEFETLLYGITQIHWINNKAFYFSAKKGDHFGIYLGNIDGEITPIIFDNKKDYLYPQKIGPMLYCIERTCQGDYAISNQYFSEDTNEPKNMKIARFGKCPIIFLDMHTQEIGYVIEYVPHAENEYILFKYHCIEKDNEQWLKKELFQFHLPLHILVNAKTRLYESIIPLKPKHIESCIFYADWDMLQSKITTKMYYNEDSVKSQYKENKYALDRLHGFSPVRLADRIYFGVFLPNQSKIDFELGLPKIVL